MKKRVLSMVLVLAFVFCLVPFGMGSLTNDGNILLDDDGTELDVLLNEELTELTELTDDEDDDSDDETSSDDEGSEETAYDDVEDELEDDSALQDDIFAADDSDMSLGIMSTSAEITPFSTSTNVTDFAQLQEAVASYATATDDMTIIIGADFSLTANTTIPANPNGKTLTITSDSTVRTLTRGFADNSGNGLFIIGSGAKVIMERIVVDGDKEFMASSASLIRVNHDGTFTLNEGAVLRNNGGNSAGVDGSSGGVAIFGGTFLMTGGEISNNDTYYRGGGVSLSGINGGSFTMTGGKISGNNSNSAGGVFVNYGTFTMEGGEISSNSGAECGGVFVCPGTFTMTGGSITGNMSRDWGSAVYVVAGGIFTMSDGEITANTILRSLTSSSVFGAIDILEESMFTMTGGKINNNSTTINNSNASANYSSGVSVRNNSHFRLGGTAVIEDNEKNSSERNVYLADGHYITLGNESNGMAAPAAGMKVGVSTATASGVIVETGATAGHAAYFHADEDGKVVEYESGKLILRNEMLTSTISVSSLSSFGSLAMYYMQPDAQTVTITNTGTGAVTLTQPTSTNYIIGDLSATTLAANGGTATFTVRPKVGLPIDNYDETIAITGSNGAGATVDVSFTVTPILTFDQLKDAVTMYATAIDDMTLVVGADFDLTANTTIPENPYGKKLTITSDGTVRTLTKGYEISNNDTLSNDDTLFMVGSNVHLIFERIVIDGNKVAYTNHHEALVTVVSGGFLQLNDGAVLRNNHSVGIYSGSSTFTMNGGVIANNERGVVIQYSSIFTMLGGEISANSGGGVYLFDSVFTMENGKVNGNTATNSSGAGIDMRDSEFIMLGGEISNNVLNWDGGNIRTYVSGGVLISGGTFTMKGGKISGNSSSEGGGGVTLNGNAEFIMEDGEISGNTAVGGGGGVYLDYGDGIFTMTGGKIIYNTAGSGGGVFFGCSSHSDDVFTMTGGEISGNTASVQGGGLTLIYGTYNLGGTARIRNNVSTADGLNNMHLIDNQEKHITLGNGSNGIAAPAAGMEVWVSTDASDGVIVNSGAKAGDVAFFHADGHGKWVEHENSKLVIKNAPTYTVKFLDWNGTILGTQTVVHGQGAIMPDGAPLRSGYTFTGWDKAFDNVTSDLVVTAQYTRNTAPTPTPTPTPNPGSGGNQDGNDQGEDNNNQGGNNQGGNNNNQGGNNQGQNNNNQGQNNNGQGGNTAIQSQAVTLPLEGVIDEGVITAALEEDEPHIVLDANTGTTISEDALQQIRSEGKAVTFELENGVVITIDPETITDNARTIDLNVDIYFVFDSTEFRKHDEHAGAQIPSNSIIIAPATHGQFGFEISITLTTAQLEAHGMSADSIMLYHVDDNGNVTVNGTLTVNRDGSVTIRYSHASFYVLSENPPTSLNTTDAFGADANEDGETQIGEGVPQEPIAPITASVSGDTSMDLDDEDLLLMSELGIWIISGIAAAGAVAAVVIILKKRR